MDIKERHLYSDFDIKIKLGYLVVKVLNINYEPARKQWYVQNHCHSSYELHFIPAGKGTLRVQDKLYQITPGTFYLTGPGVYHEQKSDDSYPMSECCLNFEYEILDKRYLKEDFYLEPEINEIINNINDTKFWFGQDEYSTTELFKKIKWELDNKKTGYFITIQSLITQIIINGLRCLSACSSAGYDIPSKTLDEKKRFIIDSFFREYNQSISPDILASSLGISTRQLNRTMQQYFSMSFKEKLINTRLDQAKDLLTNTDLTAEQIAQKVGFSSITYFYRVFKEIEKTTPISFRRRTNHLL